MVEIAVTVADGLHVHGLVRRLRGLFDSSTVIYDAANEQVRVSSEWESRTLIAVVDAVQGWMDESGAASALLAVGDRSYTLVGSGLVAPTIEADSQLRALATISAVVGSAQGADDSVALLDRTCESFSRQLGFERAGIVRDLPEVGRTEAIASHGWALHELTELVASADLQGSLQEADNTAALVLSRGNTPGAATGAVVVVPLITGDRSHGFLIADHRGTIFDLDASERALLSTLGTVISALLERTIARDSHLNGGTVMRDFIALASHELRTPTAAVCGIAATLHRQGDLLSADQRRSLSQVLYEQGQRLHLLIDQLLDLSRLEATSVRIEPVHLAVREKTEQIVRGVADERAEEIDIRIDPTLLAEADAVAFDRIVSNLITNALRYGRRPIAISASAHDRHFRLAVEDRGPGVPRELESQVFDRFTRGDHAVKSGAGLGLSIARAYARAHGGELVYEKATPNGARFELVLPIA
jgi:signal transduction histidine kinase